MTFRIRKPTIFDVQFISEHARTLDRLEVKLISDKTIAQNLFENNIFAEGWVAEMHGKVFCIYGITPYEDRKGVPWFLATEEFDKYKNIVKNKCRKEFLRITKDYDYLFNYVYVNHEKSIRWIKWLGFTVHEPVVLGPYNAEFCKFEVSKNV